MMPEEKFAQPGPAFYRRSRRLKFAGVAVWLTGLACAGWVYRSGTRALLQGDDPAMIGFDRAAHRQMGLLFGGAGSVMDDVAGDLKNPRVQAWLIAGAATVIALGCFYFSQPLAKDFPDADGNGWPRK